MGKLMTVDQIMRMLTKKAVTFDCDVIGIVLHARTYRQVQWKEEEIISLSNGKNILIDISFWKNHKEPKSCNLHFSNESKGKIVIARNVRVMAFLDKSDDKTQIQGEVKTESNSTRHIFTLLTTPLSIKLFLESDHSFEIDPAHSVIPKYIADKKAGIKFPILTNEIRLCKQVVMHHQTYQRIKNGELLQVNTYMSRAINRMLTSGTNQCDYNEIVKAMSNLDI